jgi:radical SAM superfamily enzyme YgiQ (UPF0313 family)
MKILLIAPPVTEPSSFSTLEKTPPLGIGYLIEVLRQEGHEVIFKDLYLNPGLLNEIESILHRDSVELLGVSMNTICYSGGMAIIELAQKLREKKAWFGKIAVGGPHSSVFPETIPEYVDHICKGEGEETIKAIANGDYLPRVLDGIKIQNLDDLPFVPYHEFISSPYHFSNQWINKNKVFTLSTSRGCPFSCQFCSVSSVWGNRYRFQSAERIIEEIIKLKTDYNAQGIYFREDNFTLNRKRLVRFCELLLCKGVKLPWICETRASTLNEEIVKLMAKAGCRGFYVGAESGSQRVLDYMKKGITLEQVENVVNWSRKAGIRCYLSFVLGVPTETDEERHKTLIFINRLKPYSYSLGIFAGIPFSPFYWSLLEHGDYGLITSSGIIYQKNHNQILEQFVGNLDCVKPEGVKDASREMLPILKSKMGMVQSTADKILILQIRKNSQRLIENILLLNQKLSNPTMLLLNCSGNDDVMLALTALYDEHPIFIIKNVRPRQQISTINSILNIITQYVLFVDYSDDIDGQFLENIYQEMATNNVIGVFRSFKSEMPILVENLPDLKKWFDAGRLLDNKMWACNGVSFRKLGGVDKLFSAAYLLDFASKLVRLGPVKIYPAAGPEPEFLSDNYKLFGPVLERRVNGDMIGAASLCKLDNTNTYSMDNVGKVEEAVVSYFRGRAKLRSRQFNLARGQFLEALRKDFNIKYLIFIIATLLPSRLYSTFANITNRVRRLLIK